MKYMIINTFFGWLCKAPLLYTSVDWIMAVCELILIYIALVHTSTEKVIDTLLILFTGMANLEWDMLHFTRKSKMIKTSKSLKYNSKRTTTKKLK